MNRIQISILISVFSLVISCGTAPVKPDTTNTPVIDSTHQEVYQCPMHPNVVSNTKGSKCTECSMALKKVK